MFQIYGLPGRLASGSLAWEGRHPCRIPVGNLTPRTKGRQGCRRSQVLRSDREQLLALGAKLLQVRECLGLDIAPDERFGAAGAKRDPFVVREQEFVAVQGDELFDFERPNGFQAARELS